MTIEQIYQLALQLALKEDLRGEKVVKKKLVKLKEKYQQLDKTQKAEFDTERLVNPYADSRLYAKNKQHRVKKLLTGIDIDTGEVLLAKQLGADAVLSHHPVGSAFAGIDEVMDMQVEILAQEGIPINIAQSLIHLRASEVGRSVTRLNHYKAVDSAQLLGLPIMCAHTFADNLVTRYLHDLIQKKKKELETLSDVMQLLKSIPEYAQAIKQKSGPQIFVGRPESYCGRIGILEMTGGTNGSKDIYEKMSQAGVGTVIGMHMDEEWKKEAEKYHVNVVIAGHISSDSIGMNLLLDEIEKRGVEIIPCSGLIRVKRYK